MLFPLSKTALGYEENPEIIPISVLAVEYSSHEGEMADISSIDINLPPWTLENLELSIKNIRAEYDEVKEIVSNTENQEKLSGKEDVQALAVQVNVTESIMLSSIYIHAKASGAQLEPIYLKLQGYDSCSNRPNSTIYGSPLEVNISSGIDWYEQKFSSPLQVSKGQYFIVLDGRSIENDATNYFWSYDETPQLYSSYFDDDDESWESRGSSSPFSYKLKIFHNDSYLPEEVDACVELDSNLYPINDSGIIHLNDLNLKIDSDTLNLNFAHNSSHQLIFDVKYNASLINELQASGIMALSNHQPNQWLVKPAFFRCGYEYHAQFNIPKNWYDVKVYRNGMDVSETVLIEDYLMYISNSSIDVNDEWEIRAFSPNYNYEIEHSEDEWDPSEQIGFFITTPSISGNITFKLVDQYKQVYHEEIKAVVSNITYFSYTITPEISTGIYDAIFIWQNGTDVGFQVNSFYLSGITPPASNPFFEIVLIIGVISVLMGSAIYAVTKVKDNDYFKQKSENRTLEDMIHLKYILVSQKGSGLNVYQHYITGDKSKSALVSSYMSAIHSLGLDIFDSNEDFPILKIEFEDYFLLLANARHSRTIFAMSKSPNNDFLSTLKEIAKDIDLIYGSLIENFAGKLEDFKSVGRLIERHIPLTLLYPFRLVYPKYSALTAEESRIIVRARKIMSLHKTQHVYAHSLLGGSITRQEITRIAKLIEKGVFIPIKNN